MRVQQIKMMIEKAIKEEQHTNRLAGTFKQLAESRGLQLTSDQINGAVTFVREYIEHVPYYLEQAAASSRSAGVSAEMEQMIGELEAYWFNANDLIPDRFGLMGLMDDAYASLLLLQGMSDYCVTTVGRPLLGQNLTPLNQAMRQLIGEPVVFQIEQAVGVTIGQAMMQRILTQVVSGPSFVPFAGGGGDPIYGNASIDEIVTARLGALGVV